MADIKINDLAAYTDPVSTDVLPIVDVGNDLTKKVSIADLLENAGTGSASAPSFSFDGNNNTGVYLAGVDQVALTAGGTQALLAESTGITIPGNLTVSGTTTTIETTTLDVEDNNIEMGAVTTPTDVTADGGGITLKGATDKTINWVNSTGAWTFNQPVSVTGDLTIPDKIIHSGDTDTFIRFPAADTFSIDTAGSERLRIDSSGRLLVGTSSARSNLSNTWGATFTPPVQIETGGDTNNSGLALINNSSITYSPTLTFANSRNNSVGSNSIIGNGQSLGYINFSGSDGTNFIRAAEISAFVGGTPGANDMPGRLTFSTTADGASSPTERMQIDSSGNVGIGTTAPGSYAKFAVFGVQNVATYGDVSAIFSDGTTGSARFHHSAGNVKLSSDSALTFGTGASATEKMRIDSSGVVKLTQSGSNPRYGSFEASSDAFKLKAFSGNASHNATMQFFTGADSPTERMRIDSSGKLNIAGSGNLQSSIVSVDGGNYGVANCFAGKVANTEYWNYVGISPTNAVNFVVYGTGNVANANNSYGAYSDAKLKENIVDAGSQWEDFKAVRFRKFNFKEETGFETHTQLGVIAQELELTSPNLIDERKDVDNEGNDLGTTTKSVKTSILTMKAIVALQEAMARIETLEQRLTDAGIA